jgi:hypothetical protein
MNKMFGFLAVAGLLLAGMSMDGAQALSLSNPVAAGTAKYASEGFTTEVRGGGHRGGGGISVIAAGIMLRRFTGVAGRSGHITDREGSAERRDIGKRQGSRLAAASKSD